MNINSELAILDIGTLTADLLIIAKKMNISRNALIQLDMSQVAAWKAEMEWIAAHTLLPNDPYTGKSPRLIPVLLNQSIRGEKWEPDVAAVAPDGAQIQCNDGKFNTCSGRSGDIDWREPGDISGFRLDGIAVFSAGRNSGGDGQYVVIDVLQQWVMVEGNRFAGGGGPGIYLPAKGNVIHER